MPELRFGQQTFTVRFQPVVDEIGAGTPYLGRWQGLCADYQQRVSEFPRLRRKLDEEIGLTNLSPEVRRDFQEFVEEINVLLDVDLPVVKHEFFADAWKLGVTVHRSDMEVRSYSVYTIAKGENAPLLMHAPEAGERPRLSIEGGPELEGIISFHIEGPGAGVSRAWMRREGFESAVESARNFVFRYFAKLLRRHGLHVHGRHVSAELLTRFLDEYAHTFGLARAETYRVADLSYGVNVFFPMWYSLALPETLQFFETEYPDMLRHNPFPSFEQIANVARRPVQPAEAEIREAIEAGEQPEAWPLRFDEFSLQSLRQAVEFLVAAEVEEIAALYRPSTRDGRVVWHCYALDDLKRNAVAMLRGAAADYAAFVRGNRFGRLDCPLLTGERAIIAVLRPAAWHHPEHPPTYDEWIVENADRSLPLLTIVDLDEEPGAFVQEDRVVALRGERRRWTRSSRRNLENFVRDQPLRATLYRWLVEDLERRFERKIT
jgi:hypothetical protein